VPTYSYECPDCVWCADIYSQSMTDSKSDKVKFCPLCGAKVRRLIGKGGGVIFKGPGFYATDYRKDTKHGRKEKP